MCGSTKWIKSLITQRKSQTTHQDCDPEAILKNSKLWRSSSETLVCPDHAFAAAVSIVVRAPPKDFMAVSRQWAAIRIQTAFRGFLARRAFRALRAVVRIQAIFRGWQIRKQADVTLKCMQALVRVQTRVIHCSTMSSEGNALHKLANAFPSCKTDHTENGKLRHRRCISTMDRVGSNLQAKQDSTQQRLKSNCDPNLRTRSPVISLRNQWLNKKSPGEWSLLGRWMAAKSWENSLKRIDNSPNTRSCDKNEDNTSGTYSYSTALTSNFPCSESSATTSTVSSFLNLNANTTPLIDKWDDVDTRGKKSSFTKLMAKSSKYRQTVHKYAEEVNSKAVFKDLYPPVLFD